MRKLKSTLSNPIYQGNFTRAVNRQAQGILSKKPRRKKKRLLTGEQRLIAAELLARRAQTAKLARNSACVFCLLDRTIILKSGLSIAFFDSYPISKGHTLIVPKRHITSLWDMTDEEYADAFALVRSVKELLSKQFAPDGFNVGVNYGEPAGPSVAHAHVNVIPRYQGDTPILLTHLATYRRRV